MNDTPTAAPVSAGMFDEDRTALEIADETPCIEVRDLDLYYGAEQALKQIELTIPHNRVTAFIGPSGCGKSTLLRCFNRMNDLIDICRIDGEIRIDGQDIYARDVDVAEHRRRVGMVFQKPNPFPKSIYENVAYGLRLQGVNDKRKLAEVGGQQQRLVIARAIAIEPEVILLDEPCSALDPISTAKVEELIQELKNDYTIVIVTHNMQQAARVSDFTAYMYMGEMIEFDDTARLFTNPRRKATEDYITGRYG